MADYYCEPDLYSYAATPAWALAQEGDGRNGSGASLTAVLTAGAVSSVTVNAGGSGYSQNTRVYFSGGGGSGATASLSVNDSGAITSVTVGNGGSNYTSAPTVSLVPGAAVPATGKIVFSAVPTTGTITVCGASVSTTGVLNAASADAAANSLASNINATTATINSGTSPSTPQLRDFTYARGPSNGAPSGTCEIMTRAGSHQHNNDVNSNCAITSTLNNATVTQFGASGMQRGRSGAWGWLWNTAAIWPSAQAVASYGVFFSAASKAPLAGPALTTSDICRIRANNVTITTDRVAAGASFTLTRSSIFEVDDGTVWIGDAGTLTMAFTGAATLAVFLQPGTAGMILSASTLGRWQWRNDMSATLTAFAFNTSGQCALVRNVELIDAAAAIAVANSNTLNSVECFERCKFTFGRNAFYSLLTNAGNNSAVMFDECEFSWPAFTGAAGGLISVTNTTNAGHFITLRNCKAAFAVEPASRPTPFVSIGASTAIAKSARFIAQNLDGFAMPSALYGLADQMSAANPNEPAYVLLQNVGANREFRLESNIGVVDWMAGQGYPTLNSYLPNGLAWCYRYRWTTSENSVRLFDPPVVLALTKTNILATGARTIALELFVDDSLDHLFTTAHAAIAVSYVADSDGKSYAETTFAGHKSFFSAPAIAASAQSWTGNSYAATHVARKLQLTTTRAVRQNTEIEVALKFYRPAPGLQDVFVNPEVTIS